MTAGLIAMVQMTAPKFHDISTQEFTTKSADGAEISMRWFTKTGSRSEPGAAVLNIHGGGMVAGNVDMTAPMVSQFVSATGVPFLSVEYRLAPEVRAPKPLEDCYAALQYLVENASKLGVDPARIGVLGESAGGGLAACLAHYAKEKSGPAIKKQILIYPMLDDRTIKRDPNVEPFAVFTYEANETGWRALLGDTYSTPDVPATHAAGRTTVEQAESLPSAYIDIGQLDILRDEALEYATKLSKAGVDTEFHLFPGVPHGFEVLAPQCEATKLAMQQRCKAISSL